MAKRGAAVRGQATARTESVSAPIGGLNAVDSIAAMPPTDAVVMDNFFAQPTYVSLRNGYQNWVTGITGWIETLMGYASLATSEKLFGIAGTSVYDVTAAGAVGSAVVTGLTNARWEWTDVAVPGGAYLYAANGVDAPLLYDGSTWVKITGISTPAITGVTPTTLRNPVVWKSRVWFVQNNTNLAWYLPTQAIGGAAKSFDLSTIFRKGGSLQVIMTFSVSSTTSFDDYIGFLSTEGELAVYQGTDPDTSGAFAITGVYEVGKPIGRRCWFKYGSDAIIIGADGAVSVTKLIAVGAQQPQSAITYKIMQLINADTAAYFNNFGWQGTVYPLGNKLYINIPENTSSRYHQYVMNTLNGAWCSYGLISSPWNAATFCVLGNNIYFGTNGIVAKCETGTNDNGNQILGSVLPAFGYMKTDRQKQFTMVRPILQTTGTVTPTLSLNTDFNVVLPTGTPTFSTTSQPLWNVALWNVSYWATGPFIQKDWQTVTGVGFSASVYMQIASTLSSVNFLSNDFLFKPGGVL